MVIYLYGPDSYRRREKLKEILVKYRLKHSAATVGNFFLDEKEEFVRLQNFASSQSLFGGSRLAVIYGVANDKNIGEFLKLHLQSPNISFVILTEKELGKNFDFLLKKPVLSQEFKKLSGMQIAVFIKKEAENRGIKLSPETLSALVSYGVDTWSIVNELDKVALGGCPEYLESAPNFFTLLSYLKSSRLFDQRVVSLTRLLESEDSAKIFNMLAVQDVSDSAVWKIKMADYDVAIKSGKLDYPEALLDFALS